ncbi:MBL fold metallo-hydrolase [Halioxenophilus aromaticivorans]|uniref:MBL fold metallo-hydrolase n=1 Tax=Halioxenophilus aromaticivorans TaxID=1306992 RepID=A0AAV3U5A4_9ALTE
MLTQDRFEVDGVTGLRVGGGLFGKPLMTVILYRVGDLLIDTASYHTRPLVRQFVQESPIRQVLLTHFHEDHAGNAGYLQREFGLPVLGHTNTAARLANPVRLLPYEHFMFGKLETATVEPYLSLIRCGDVQLTPIPTPGHCDDHTVYLERNKGWLFSGDLFVASKIKIWRKSENMEQTIRALDTVLQQDFEILFCGHNPQYKNAKTLVKQKRDQLNGLVEQAVALRQRGCGFSEIYNRMDVGQEKWVTKLITFGDVSYRNMIKAAMVAADERLLGQ